MSEQLNLLTAADGEPVSEINIPGKSEVLLICEHASRRLPAKLGTLGLAPAALKAHIAWDPGALAVASLMSAALDAALIHQNFSRLAYDCNRPPEASDAMPSKSEIYDIPGNASLSRAEKDARTRAIYQPFGSAIARRISERKAQARETVLVTVHSFTPVYRGVSRDVEIGILHDRDSRLADQMLRLAGAGSRYRMRRNEPYGPADGVTHTLKEHGLANGLLNVMIEVRNDLVQNEAGQEVVAGFLAGLIRESLAIHA
ncbi:MAG: N-formylglutamate amidohydrolase [Rhizobium sp.]|nr:N-formylglutamate amidohydrolase [Rhizobium sp.]